VVWTLAACARFLSSLPFDPAPGTIFRRPASPFHVLAWSCLFLIFAAARPALAAPPTAGEPAGPLKVALFLSSDSTRCYESELARAIRLFTTAEVREINRDGGVGGRPIRLVVSDTLEDPQRALGAVAAALRDPLTLAMIGLSSSKTGKAVFESLGPEVRASRIPFITDMSNDYIFAPYPNVFTMTVGMSDEMERLRAFITSGGPDGAGFKRTAVIGIAGDLYSQSVGEALVQLPPEHPLVVDHRVQVGKNHRIGQEDVARIAADIQAKAADLVLLAVGSVAGARIVKSLDELGVSATYFVAAGEISELRQAAQGLRSAPRMYAFQWDDVPHTINERMRRRIASTPDVNWTRIRAAVPLARDSNPNWLNGRCKPPQDKDRSGIDHYLVGALSGGAEWRDVLRLIVDLAREQAAQGKRTLGELHTGILESLLSYESKRKIYRGWAYDYSFTKRRAIADDTYIVTLSGNNQHVVLASTQMFRVAGKLKPRPVIPLSLDLISIDRINSNDGTFDAEFYLSFKNPSNGLGIDSIRFTNAFRSPTGDSKLLVKEEVHAGSADTDFPAGVQVYRVSGTFTFEPRLGRYPFDTQNLSISFRPAQTKAPFLIQPPEDALRSSPDLAVEGWEVREQFVGTDQEIIPALDPVSDGKRFIPSYTFTYTWVIERNATDYRLRVIAPLAFILLVTFFSVLLAKARFDATVAIQVTALLSAIALYLSLPKVDSDEATLSDKIFLLTYAMVAFMIGLTVIRDMRYVDERAALRGFVRFLELIVFPLVAIGMLAWLLNFADVPQSVRDLIASL